MANRPSESNSTFTCTSPAGMGTSEAANCQLTANCPGAVVQLLSFRYHVVRVVYGPFVVARRIFRISVPFRDSVFGPRLSTVPLR